MLCGFVRSNVPGCIPSRMIIMQHAGSLDSRAPSVTWDREGGESEVNSSKDILVEVKDLKKYFR